MKIKKFIGKCITRAIMSSMLLYLMATPTIVNAQGVYKGKLLISDEKFYCEGYMLHVYMRVSFGKDAIGSENQLVFTPVIKTDINEYRLSTVVINGEKRLKAEDRAEAFQHRLKPNIPVIMEDSSMTASKKYFIYNASIPYARWMENGELYIKSEENNCNGRCTHVYEDCLLTKIPIKKDSLLNTDGSAGGKEGITSRYDITKWVQFYTTPSSENESFTRSDIIEWKSGKQDMSKMDEKTQNKYICNILDEKIKEVLKQYGTTIGGVIVTGYGCPIGNFSKNEKRGMERALSLKCYLMKNLVTNKNNLNVSWVNEDWDYIAMLLSKGNMPLRDAVLDIIKTVNVADGREQVIKNLNEGIPYLYMTKNIFPKVKRVTYTLTFNHKDLDVGAAKLMLKCQPENMTAKDYYTVANSYEKGSREFNDIIYLLVRLFPDSPEANINAAAVAMLRNDTELARKYLTRWQTDPRAYENMGVLNLLEGNQGKAEVYLKMAQANGSKEAVNAINALNIK